MTTIRRLVLDVMIPLNVPSSELALKLSKLTGVDGVDLLVTEVEHRIEKAKITMEGENINLDAVRTLLDKTGASLQGVDRITCGKRVVG
ncbi:DUF211 domain-containing protein [Candidatus Micrarchaeota archaeon]|jgi:hypothetical protein|nr:DUF211 domain-containing protein [Candidatus Micrarchaeota archaeon]